VSTADPSAPNLILLDLDGTLLGDDGEVSERNASAIQRATAAGARVVIATGRPARLLERLRTQLESSLALCYNGAVVLDLTTWEVLDARFLPGDAFRSAIESARGAGIEVVVAAEGLPHVGIRAEPGLRPDADLPRGTLAELAGGEIVKGLVRAAPHMFDRAWEFLTDNYSDVLTVTRSGVEGLIELSGPGVSKGSTIAALAETWGIAAEDAIAFGDMPNDLEMFEWAGRSVAMANADAAVAFAASEQGESNNADGVAKVLERWF
jgi:hydroxymethylpyrimidine pyrophosphatase-like HAD family hydrolase